MDAIDPEALAPQLPVLENEEPWTGAEVAEVAQQLSADVTRLTAELGAAESELADLIRSSTEKAGNDQADIGFASVGREQEVSIANHAREGLLQAHRALQRLADNTYGECENCGKPIGKHRLMAFPRAVMCMDCKRRQERR